MADWCTYCSGDSSIKTDVDGEIHISKMIPFPAIDLTNGRICEAVDPPYWAARILVDGVEDFARIYFCPMCGRQLPSLEHDVEQLRAVEAWTRRTGGAHG